MPRIPTKAHKLSLKVRRAISMIATGEAHSQTDAARAVGIDRSHLSRLMNTDAGRAFVDAEARRILSAGRARAAGRMMELGNGSAGRVALESARFGLGTGGIGA